MSFTNTELVESRTSNAVNAALIQMTKGEITQMQTHPSETIIVVLEGAWRFRIEGRAVTLNKDEVLRIAAYEYYSSEALTDTIALKIEGLSHDEVQQLALPHEDPDQYLWGV